MHHLLPRVTHSVKTVHESTYSLGQPTYYPLIATGVDYTGAIKLKAERLRRTSRYKGYIAIFIFLATKAVHPEAFTGLSHEHFPQPV